MTHPKFATTILPALFVFLFSFLLALTPAPAAAAEKSKKSDENLVTLKVLINGESRKILIELHPEAAPLHVANFKKHVADGFYDNHAFHRVIRGYLIQVGDPLSREPGEKDNWGTGGPGHTIPAEIGLPHNRGAVAMARLHKNNPNKESSGSQFYFCLTPIPQLDREYTVFGKVVEGMDVLDAMSDSLTDSNDTPVRRIELKTAALGDVGAIGSLSMPNPVAGTKKAIAAIPNPLNMFGGKKDKDLSDKPAAYGDSEVPEGELPDVEYASEMNDVPSGPVDAPEKEGFMKKLNPFGGKKDKDLAAAADTSIDTASATDAAAQIPDASSDPVDATEKEGFMKKLNPFNGKKDKDLAAASDSASTADASARIPDASSDPVDAPEKEGFMKKLNPFNGKKDKDLVLSSDATPINAPPAPVASGDLPDVEYAADMTNLDTTPEKEKEGGFFGKLNPFGGKKNKDDEANAPAAYEYVDPAATTPDPADRNIPPPPSLPAGVTAAAAVDPTTSASDPDQPSSPLPAEPLGGLDKISQLNFGNSDGTAPSRKPKKTEAEKGAFTKFIERLW